MALWCQRRWRRLLNLIDHLPSASHFAEAQANDDEVARAWLESGEAASSFAPRISTWDPAVAELTNVTDRLAELTSVLIGVNGGQPKQVKPRPRPVTAIDRVERQIRQEKHDQLVARMLRDPSA